MKDIKYVLDHIVSKKQVLKLLQNCIDYFPNSDKALAEYVGEEYHPYIDEDDCQELMQLGLEELKMLLQFYKVTPESE